MIEYRIYVGCVDGVSAYNCASQNKAEVLEFLKKHDHEGSTIMLDIHMTNPDDIYKLLQE